MSNPLVTKYSIVNPHVKNLETDSFTIFRLLFIYFTNIFYNNKRARIF